MTSEIPGFNPENKVKFSNVQVHLIVGAHISGTASEYATIRKNIENTGTSFFKRGFTNILFLEETTGGLSAGLEKLNDDAERLRSWRKAYWTSALDVDDERAAEIVTVVDSNTQGVFAKLKQEGDQEKMEGWEFAYSVFTAMNGMRRKGVDLILASEHPTDIRKSSLKKMGDQSLHKLESAKASAEAARIGDIGMAKDITDLMNKYPTNARILGVMGAVHARVVNFLPVVLGDVRVSLFNGNEHNPVVQSIFDVQDGQDETLLNAAKSKGFV